MRHRRRSCGSHSTCWIQRVQVISAMIDLLENEAHRAFATGKVAAADIRVVLRALGYDPSKEDVEKLVSKFDSSKTGALDFSEYMDLLIDKMVTNTNGFVVTP